jgi:subtilisin family serine protease
MAEVMDEIVGATIELPHDVAARFALVARPSQDPVALAALVQAQLAFLGARVAPISTLDPQALVLELPGRAFNAEAANAFAAAYALEEAFDLAAAEPDLPTEFFPEEPPTRDGKDPARESLDDFPPGCWAPAEPALDKNPLWALRAIRVPEAWAFSEERRRLSRGEGVVVAQPDTGVTRHIELDDILTVPGFDIISGDADPTDPLVGGGNPGHGTATASVLVSPETLVVAGSAPRARHMAIRAIESVVRVTQISVAQAIDWAVANGAQVITMSLGGIPSFSLHRALLRAVEADVIVLAAAGNCVRTVVWPARYDDCIAVAGTNSRDEPWRGSCCGAAVDISAPGENVFRARVPEGAAPGNAEVGQGQGTSFAVALTAGVAALWLAHHGRANLVAAARARGETLQVMFRRLLRATARRPAVWDPFEMGAGIVDARALLEADFNLGRDREAAEPPSDPRVRAAITVESLVAETLGPEAALDQSLDWHRFGPEIATALLRQRLAVRGTARGVGLRPEAGVEQAPEPPRVSNRLAEAAIGAPPLRKWLSPATNLGGGPVEVEVGREGAAP